MIRFREGNLKGLIARILILFFVILINPHYSRADENRWRLMGKTEEDKYYLYIDTQSITYPSENIMRFKAKKELTPEAMEERKRVFYESVRRAEKESGAKVEDPEDLFKIIIRWEIKKFLYEIDCEKNELRNIPLKVMRH